MNSCILAAGCERLRFKTQWRHGPQCGWDGIRSDELSESGGFPVIDELSQARSFQRPPIEQHAIGALNGSESAPFVGGETSVVAGHEANQAPCCGAEREAEQQAAGAGGEMQVGRKGKKVLGFHAPNLLSFEIGVVIGGQKNCKRVVISVISGNLRSRLATVRLTIRKFSLELSPPATIEASSGWPIREYPLSFSSTRRNAAVIFY